MPTSASGPGIRVWYRGSEGCPEGESFIALLQSFGRRASLAKVGDRVDFVVTLAAAGGGGSNGRLERQSVERTVTIREVAAASCQEAADALALSLDLALQPGAEPLAASEPRVNERWQREIGAQGTLETGLANALLPGAAIFVSIGPAAQGWQARGSLRGVYGERQSAVQVDVGLLAARLEGCWAWELAQRFTLAPCAALEYGLVFAESRDEDGRADAGTWAGLVAHGRAQWQISETLELEAQMGLMTPFVRYEFVARSGEQVTNSAPLGLQAALGFSFRL